MTSDYVSVLAHEFSGEEGSFLLQLRVEMAWDNSAFSRLTEAMLACCRAYDEGNPQPTLFGPTYDTARLPRWLAGGFWHVCTFVEGHTSHPAWSARKAREQAYYDAAYQRLFMLGEWFFTGKCPYKDPDRGFAPM